MQEHYVRLLTDIELGPKQKHVWYRVVESFLGADFAPEPENFIDQLTSSREELEGDEDFPYVYVVYLSDIIDPDLVEQIVMTWSEIYPKDFEIETSAEYDDECTDCDVEIDDSLHEEIQRQASKFLHNRWVESQLQEGWRYGLRVNNSDKVSPKLRDWDSLNEQYRREIEMTREQAVSFFKKYPYIFT